ncbi:MAG: sugar ABC transporter ATP-binding protein [Actinobacteria bacterium]|nr:MAG: sugar ABC transporter ATP-binding protein [Actinomycetota bacterium]
MSLLEARNVGKRYGPVVALESASLSVDAGEVHALLGANGAGKSTLVKILTGVIQRDGGTVELRGEPVRVSSPSRAARIGLAPVFQDPALVPDLTVAQNIRLTAVDVDAVRQRLREMDVDVDFTEQAGDVPLPLLRMIDLARAMARDPQLLLLDEITAALPSDLAERVFAVMEDWRRRGRSVLFITHRLAEVIAMCDRATVLRDGRDVGTLVPREIGERQIVEYMLGPEAATAEAHAAEVDETPLKGAAAAEAAATTLEVTDLRVGSLAGVSFSLRAGEILGVAALEGQGQNDLFAVLAGDRRAEGGEMSVTGKSLRPRHPYDAIRSGLVLVPADRLLALLPQRSVRENIAAPRYNRLGRWGPINPREERRRVASAIEALQIDTRAQRQVRRLSGGNQQKVTIARWLASGFQTLLCFDPTRGIDVGTKRQIYALLRRLADDGAAILFFSSELSEFPLVCDRVLTLFGGRITGELAGEGADEASLLRAMHGLVEEVAS